MRECLRSAGALYLLLPGCPLSRLGLRNSGDQQGMRPLRAREKSGTPTCVTCVARCNFGQAFVRFLTQVGGTKAGCRVRMALTCFPFACSPGANRAPAQVSVPPTVGEVLFDTQARTAFIRTLAGLGGRVGPCPNRTPCDSDGLRLKVVSVCVTVSESEVSYPLGVRSHRSPSASVASGLYFYLLLLVSCVTVSRGGT